jgi:hypothetical protein
MDGRQEGEVSVAFLSRADQFHGTGLSSSSGNLLVAILRASGLIAGMQASSSPADRGAAGARDRCDRCARSRLFLAG